MRQYAWPGQCPAGHPGDGFDHVVEVALGIGAAGDGETDQVHRGRDLGAVGPQAEHDGSDLAGPHSAFLIQRAGQRLARVVQRVQVRQQRAGVDEDRVAAERDHDRHSRGLQRLTEVGDRAHPVAQVPLVSALAQPLGDGLQVPAGRGVIRHLLL